eukprot:scaffold23073_cov97-Isochrysis_galbana.AAC.1
MFATVHAAGSSLLGLFTSCTTFDSTFSQPRPVSRAWFSPLSMRCLRPCTPPVRLFSVYSLRVQPFDSQRTTAPCQTKNRLQRARASEPRHAR